MAEGLLCRWIGGTPMTSFQFRTVAAIMTAIALTAAPSFAQRGNRRNGGEGGRRDGVERARPRTGGETRGRAEPSQRRDDRANDNRANDNRTNGSRDDNRANDNRTNGSRDDNRANDNRANGNRGDNRSNGNRANDDRTNWPRGDGRRNDYRGYDNRSYSNRSYGYGAYGYRPYVNRSYVVPYGYRPRGYRPGWSLNLYFGRPYSSYGYPAAGYGYYSIAPGFAYGAVRIVDAPRDAQVFVDGYYAGVVDDYDGVFQRLNLEAGSHYIEIEAPGYPPIGFDVRVERGRTITYRANIR